MYSDSMVEITDSELIIKSYYFPLGGNKHLAFSEIEKIEVREPGFFNGSMRLWGGGLGVWFAFDPSRPTRDALFWVRVKDTWIKVGFTAESSENVIRELAQKGVELEIHTQ